MTKFVVDPKWTDKDSKIPRFRELYERHDFIEAYGKHTDLRVQDNPQGAIGRADEWESHGTLQLEFLIEQGLKPQHLLLDVGCGVGRAARRLVPYLEVGHYTGCDISREALAHCEKLAAAEGWGERRPRFLYSPDLKFEDGVQFDMLWAHSVFTHLPLEHIDVMVRNAARLLPTGGKFLFTYKLWGKSERTGLKQFRHAPTSFDEVAVRQGFKFEALPNMWPAHQSTGLLTRTAWTR